MPPAKKPADKKPAAKTPAEQKYVPGANFVSDDEKDKGAKKSRRRKKSGNKDESSEAGPSSTVASSSSAQTGSTAGPSVPKPSTSTGTMQTPALAAARQSTQAPGQPAMALPYSTRPIPPSAQIGTRQAVQSSSQLGHGAISTKPTNTPGPAGGPSSSQGLPAPSSPNEAALIGKASSSTDPSKGKGSSSGDGKQEVVRLTGQPPRPGTNHREDVSLTSNHFRLIHRADLVLWHYQIIVEPEIKGPKLTQVIKIALNSEFLSGERPGLVTDFSAIMLSVREIPQDRQKFKIQYKSEIEDQASADAKQYTISLNQIGTVDLSNSTAYLQQLGTGSSGLSVEQTLDIVLGHHRKLSNDIAIINKRKAFIVGSGAEEWDLDDDPSFLVALRGYFSSVRMSQSSLLVNINISHGAFYKGTKKLLDVIEWLEDSQSVHPSKVPGLLRGLRVESSHIQRVWSFWGYPKNGDGKGHMLHPPRFNDPSAPKPTPGQVQFFHELVEGPSKERAQKLNDRDAELAKKGTLKPHDENCRCLGRWLTVADYFRTIRQEPISTDDLGLPLVNVGSNKRPTYLPSHLCTVRKGQISKLKTNPDQTKEMIKFAVRNPEENATSITSNSFNTLGFNNDNRELGRFGIRVEESMVRVSGRLLPPPTLLYNAKSKKSGPSWNLFGVPFRKPAQLTNWACLRILRKPQFGNLFEKSRYDGNRAKFETHLGSKGITVHKSSNHDDLVIKDSRDYSKLDQWLKSCLQPEFQVKFLIVLLPDGAPEFYNQIKKYGDLKYGIHTVCIQKYKKFGSLPYDDNVALKINLKLGGINHQLEDAAYGCMLGDKTMVVGIDVTHPPPGSEGAPSVAAVVASCDKYLSQWPADLRINKSGQEMVEMLREMLTTRLRHYQKVNRELPKNILIYRDGVGEGQYQIVLDEELPRLRDACRVVYGKEYVEKDYPQISLIVVGKRHHTRFYRIDRNGTVLKELSGNPVSGTIVDNTITRNDNWDFYLQSHTAINGTARPAHYFVLLDEIFQKTTKNPATELERLTYNLCHLYGKATVSVSIPPPVFYADLACGRGKRYLSGVFDLDQSIDERASDADVAINDTLKDTMFYI